MPFVCVGPNVGVPVLDVGFFEGECVGSVGELLGGVGGPTVGDLLGRHKVGARDSPTPVGPNEGA